MGADPGGELFADSAIPLLDYVSGVWARAFAQEEDKVFMTGADTTQPKGLRAETLSGESQAGATLVADDLIALYYSLPVQYRNRATWIMHNDAIAAIRTLKYAADSRYVWTDGLENATPTILGRPVIEQNDIPTNLGVGTNETEIFFGDLSFYLIGDREEMGVESTTVGAGAFKKHQVAFKAWERIDGRLGLTDAFRLLDAVVPA